MCNVPVTIGLCVKNCADTIRETLNCIIGQDYPHELIEVIVVDDQSSDDTIPIVIKTLSNYSINFKVLSTNGKGLGFARQLVVKNASGKYILWVDGDMILPNNYIMQQVKFMEQNPEVGKARAKWGFLNEDYLPAKLESFRVLTHSSGNKNKLLVGIGGSICRTCALKEIGGFDEKIRGAGEDIDLSVRLAISWKNAISDAVFYHRFRKTWKSLWQQYFWYGYGIHYVNAKHKGIIKLWKYLPIISFFAGLKNFLSTIKLTKQKIAILLPFQYTFKYSAWLIGYIRSHFDQYGDLEADSSAST
ncbi:TPA: glycosyltransferase [Candidatus Poribacteria bacterium]|nr:glycosyltransferase [Candidatus Poribacteria bacterium]